MDYTLSDLIEIPKLQSLLDSFYLATGIPSGILDPEGNILTATGWRDICKNFHRTNRYSAAQCKKSDQFISNHISQNKKYYSYSCENGLIDMGAPIIIAGIHLANIYQGQFFLEEPDLDYFRSQAQRFGFDEAAYLKAVRETPVISIEKIEPIINFLVQFAEMLAELGLKQLKQLQCQKKLKEKDEASDRMKNEFLANISHELKTPINVIFSTAQLSNIYLDREISPESQEKLRRFMGIIRQNCLRSQRLVNNLLDITRIDAGFYELQLQNCDIVQHLSCLVESIRDYIASHGISISFGSSCDSLVTAYDPEKIERVVLNLISNALKFTDPGGRIAINIAPQASSVKITVADTGSGIPPDKLDIIFERFKQVDGLFVRRNEGSGIGLTIAKSIVELHNGKICVESECGKGSIFTVELPASKMDCGNAGKAEMNADKTDEVRIQRILTEFSDIYSKK